jgi:hypothetical protein
MTHTPFCAARIDRRQALRRTALGLAVLPAPLLLGGGCTALLPLTETAPGPDRDARALLDEACEAHGLQALRTLTDFSIAYDGEWRALINSVQPLVVDQGYRKTSDERWLLREGVVAQRHYGPEGHKQVVRELPRTVWGGRAEGSGSARVWYQGAETRDGGVVSSAAMVADAYALFLLGPLWLAGRDVPLKRAGIESVHGRACEVLEAWLRPGVGLSAFDRVSLAIDRRDRTMRRVTFTLEGVASTRGAIVETDTFDHVRRHGVLWPTRFFERLRRPFPNFPAHDWWVTGLDVNRGLNAAHVRGPVYTGAAEMPARPFAKT